MDNSQDFNLNPKESEMRVFRERMVKKGLELETDQLIELIAEFEVLNEKYRSMDISQGEKTELKKEMRKKEAELEQTKMKLGDKSEELISSYMGGTLFEVGKPGSSIRICPKSYNKVRDLSKFLKNKNIVQALHARETGKQLKPEQVHKPKQETLLQKSFAFVKSIFQFGGINNRGSSIKEESKLGTSKEDNIKEFLSFIENPNLLSNTIEEPKLEISKEDHLDENLSSLENPNLLSESMEAKQRSTLRYKGAKLEDKVKKATTASKEQNVSNQPFRGEKVSEKCKTD